MSGPPTGRDRAWLEQLFRLHHRAVLAYVRRRVPDGDAEDVLAEVFATAWQCRDRVPADALPWLYRTAGNHVLHALRGTSRRDRLVERVAAWSVPRGVVHDHADAVLRELDGEDTAARVRAVLDLMSPVDAEVLRLDAWEQLDGAGIASVLGCSRASARVRLHRARRRFAAALAAHTPADRPRLEVTT